MNCRLHALLSKKLLEAPRHYRHARMSTNCAIMQSLDQLSPQVYITANPDAGLVSQNAIAQRVMGN
jgi:hypothetical protein